MAGRLPLRFFQLAIQAELLFTRAGQEVIEALTNEWHGRQEAHSQLMSVDYECRPAHKKKWRVRIWRTDGAGH